MKVFTKKQKRSRRSDSGMSKSYHGASSKSTYLPQGKGYTNSKMFTRKTGLIRRVVSL